MREFELICDKDNVRLDILISEAIEGLTRSFAQKLIKTGLVNVNSELALKSTKLKVGDKIKVTIPDDDKNEVIAEEIELDIVYEDDDIMVVNKPKGMVVHPAAGNFKGTLVNALKGYTENLSDINGELRLGIVHRIDKDTSGLLLVAKTNFAHEELSSQLKEHSVKREYIGVVYGNIKDDIGTIDAPIGRNPKERKKMTVIDTDSSRDAVTHYEVIKRFVGFTEMKFILETGRTHQIRVHMANVGHPIAGDIVYGPKKAITKLAGQCLHAKTLGFIHPRTKEYMEFTSELPEYFNDFLSKLKEQ